MKTLLITLAAAATLIASAAYAADTSSSNGEVRSFNSNKQTLFGGHSLDGEQTASIGGKSIRRNSFSKSRSRASSRQVFSGLERINGREARVRYVIINGQKKIISKSFRSSDR